jgi:hypothetical protein
VVMPSLSLITEHVRAQSVEFTSKRREAIGSSSKQYVREFVGAHG